MIIEDIGPRTNIEWLWTLDLIELSWEIPRYRRLKEKTLHVSRGNAIASLLQRLDGAGMPAQTRIMVQARCERAAAEWCEDQEAASEIEARLRCSQTLLFAKTRRSRSRLLIVQWPRYFVG
jgi:hypothetical protein